MTWLLKTASIQAKLIVAVAIFVIFGVATAFTAWWSLSNVSESVETQNRIATYQSDSLRALNQLDKYGGILQSLGQSDLGSSDSEALMRIVTKRSEAFHETLTRLQRDAEGLGLKSLDPPESALESLQGAEEELLNAIKSGDSDAAGFLIASIPSASDKLQKALEAQASHARKRLAAVQDKAKTMRNRALMGMIAATALQVVLGLAAVLTIASLGISRPIGRLSAVMHRLAAGEDEVPVGDDDRRDEIGRMVSAVMVFRDQAQENRHLNQEREADAQRREAEKQEARHHLADQLETTMGEAVTAFTGASRNLTGDAQTLSQNADKAREEAGRAAQGAHRAAENVQTVSGAAEELTTSIREIGERVGEASRIAQEAQTKASDTNARVERLDKAASEIGDIVKLINDIAEQTNLLALNATIEAARAGEAGKGFAVVANEVKNLASQTTKATEDIGDKIAQVQEEASYAVKAIGSISETIQHVNTHAADIAHRVEEQNGATRDIAQNVAEASQSASTASEGIAKVTDATGEADRTAESVSSAAQQLQDQAERLKEQMQGFVSDIRAA